MNCKLTTRLRIIPPVLLIFQLLLLSAVAQQQQSLPRSTPEAEGVSSRQILSFIDAVETSNHELHSIMLLRHGKIVAEGWWNPYRPDLLHSMYSVSKSFTATAVGLAVAENKLSVDDKVISYFPKQLPDTVSPYLANLRIRHLLSMTVGQATDPTGQVFRSDDWARTFLHTPIVYEPGSRFLYNSAASYMLSAIVQKVTGQTLMQYLQTRLFDPLDIKGTDWESDPSGVNTGGWGLRLKTEDMAKFGQLFLRKGNWNGKQLLPEGWVTEASTSKIDQDPSAPKSEKESSDWLQGYGYQMWRSRHNAYRADGAFGQFIIVLPEQDAVIVLTSETADMQGAFNLVWKHLLPAFQPNKIPADKKARQQLTNRLAKLSLPPAKQTDAVLQAKISGKEYGIISGDRTLRTARFTFTGNTGELILQTDSIAHKIPLGLAKWEPGTTTLPGPYLVENAKNNRIGLSPFKTAGSFSWLNDSTLDLAIRYVESPHTSTIRCTFSGDKLQMEMGNSMNRSAKKLVRKAVASTARPNPPRLVIRGDDMGFSHSGNEALIKSYREGIVTSIEVIAPSPWFPEAVKMLAQHPRADVGLHFAITSEWDNIKWRPLTGAPSLRNADGYFYPMLHPNKNYPGQSLLDHAWKTEDIEQELRAQLILARKYIPGLSHISGHMGGTAFDPRVKEIVQKIAGEFGLRAVDLDSDKIPGSSYIWIDNRGKTTDQRIDAFIDKLDQLESGKTYVFVEHPGLDNAELRAIHHIGYENVAQDRQGVTDMLTSEKVREAIVKKGIRLVSYKELIATYK